MARRNGLRLFFDAAHAFGSRYRGTRVGGFGDAEVFSLSPTKVLIAAEGGIIATNDDLIAERCRIGRDYGNPGDYDCRFVGLNARMSEVHAAIALSSMDDLDERLARREELAVAYRRALDTVPGIGFPRVRSEDSSTFKDLTILVDPDVFELDADRLHEVLAAEGIETKRYYSPPVHRMRAYQTRGSEPVLPITDAASARALTLPLWIGMTVNDVELVATAIRRVQGRRAGLAVRDASPPVAG